MKFDPLLRQHPGFLELCDISRRVNPEASPGLENVLIIQCPCHTLTINIFHQRPA